MKTKPIGITVTYTDGEIYDVIGTFDYDETVIVITVDKRHVIIPLNAVRRIEYIE